MRNWLSDHSDCAPIYGWKPQQLGFGVPGEPDSYDASQRREGSLTPASKDPLFNQEAAKNYLFSTVKL